MLLFYGLILRPESVCQEEVGVDGVTTCDKHHMVKEVEMVSDKNLTFLHLFSP